MNIPLTYVPLSNNEFRLGINVGINGGPTQRYLFDTGSSGFNATFNPTTWNGLGSTTSPPVSPIATNNNIQYCYGNSTPTNCIGYMGNLIQVPSLTFEVPGGGTTTLTTPLGPGFGITAVTSSNFNGNPPTTFPSYFCDFSIYVCPVNPNPAPPDSGLFYGTFGAGDFVGFPRTCAMTLPGHCPPGSPQTSMSVGSVLAQIPVSNVVAQGYVVAANGQTNPANALSTAQNFPTGNTTVTVGGVTKDVTACNPCVTVGLTSEMIGQFAPVGMPAQGGKNPGLVSWGPPGSNFVNAYGGTGNNGSTEFGTNFTVTVNRTGAPPQTRTSPTLLDTGTPYFVLSKDFNLTSTTSILMTGASPENSAIPGVPTNTAVIESSNSNKGTNSVNSAGQDTNTLGLPFFMQNSVMYDLQHMAIGYTPVFVTDAPLVTTATGPLIVNGNNVWLGLAGVISGPGGVTIQNGGAIQTSAKNTYTGATIIDAGGVLWVSGPGSIASSSGVTNGGTFDISRAWEGEVSIQNLVSPPSVAGAPTPAVYLGANNLRIVNASGTFDGNMSDSGGAYSVTGGGLIIESGSQTLTGNNSYSGRTLVKGGTLALAGMGTMTGSLGIASGATFTTTGGYAVSSTSQLGNYGTFSSLPNAAQLANAGVLLNYGIFNSDVSNTGTMVNNGTITGNVTNIGLLSGNGTITGNVSNGGIVAPGNSIGTLNVVGGFAQIAGSAYQVETNAQGQADRINVSGAPGTATIAAGSSVFVAPAASGSYAPRTTYTILNATGGVTGAYSSVSSSLPFLQPSLSYDANNVYLSLQIGGFARQALTPNQAAVGAALDAGALNATGDFATVLGAFSTMNAQQGVAAMNSISGQNYSGFSSTGIATTQVFMSNFANTVGGTATGANRVALAESCDVACDATSPARWGAWGGALGGFGVVGGTANAGTLTYSLGGFAAGLDRRVTDELLVGVTAGYTSSTQWVGGFSGRGTSDTFQAGLYASYAKNAVYVDALAAYAYSDNRMTRQIALPGLARTANGWTGANLFFGQVETGYRFDIGGLADAYVTPFARLQAATANQAAFTENGAGALNLSVASQTTNSLRTVLGAQFGGAMDLGWREKLAMQVKLGWGHEYADTGRPVTASFVGAPALPFTTYGAAPQRDSVVLGLSATTAVADATSLYFRYEGNISSADSNQALTAGFRMTW